MDLFLMQFERNEEMYQNNMMKLKYYHLTIHVKQVTCWRYPQGRPISKPLYRRK